MIWYGLIAAVMLALTHLFANEVLPVGSMPRSRWLSLAGGASVAYIFVHLLPMLSEYQAHVSEALPRTAAFLQHHIYLLALLGFAAFYGLERLALSSRRNRVPNRRARQATRGDEEAPSTPPAVFWLHVGSFAVYNAVIGYLVHREEMDLWPLAVFSIAMGLHLFVTDHALREHHQRRYRTIGRWLLAAAILAGWALGMAWEMPRAAIGVLFALLSGSVILNVIKEELPEERESRWWAFALGAAAYTVIVLSEGWVARGASEA